MSKGKHPRYSRQLETTGRSNLAVGSTKITRDFNPHGFLRMLENMSMEDVRNQRLAYCLQYLHHFFKSAMAQRVGADMAYSPVPGAIESPKPGLMFRRPLRVRNELEGAYGFASGFADGYAVTKICVQMQISSNAQNATLLTNPVPVYCTMS